MKTYLANQKCFLLILVTLLLCFSTQVASGFTPVSQRTPQVRDAIVKKVLGEPVILGGRLQWEVMDFVIEQQLPTIETLFLSGKKIINLKPGDFDGLTGLKTLTLHNNRISDITPLQNLTQLTTLHLYDNLISDISPLAGLPNLTVLMLFSNAISDISPLAGLPNLTNLRLSNNRISDISPLAGLTRLTLLTLSNSRISDISPLAGLTQLTNLRLDNNNSISDISPLAGLTRLTFLYLSNNRISDISPLAGLTRLRILYLFNSRISSVGDNNSISDITPLAGLTQLTELRLDNNRISNIGNRISDISPLAGLPNLTELRLSNNRISDISPLAGLTWLTLLYLDNNRIRDVTPLEGLTSLTGLRISGNPISDYGPIRRLKAKNRGLTVWDIGSLLAVPLSDRTPQVRDAIVAAGRPIGNTAGLAAITSLDLRNKSITRLKAGDFDGLTGLTTLYLDDNGFWGIEPLEALPKLETLTLSNNGIHDISPLTGLTNLTTLRLSNNRIRDITPLEGLTRLTILSLRGNRIRYIRALKDLTQLTFLALDNNEIETISALKDLTNLTTLTLNNNNIGTISALAGLTRLTILDLHNNRIGRTTPLEGLTSLRRLTIRDNRLWDYEPLRRLKEKNPNLSIDIEIPLGVRDRTPQVRDAIVAASRAATAAHVTDAHLAKITRLDLPFKSITVLKTGDFDGLTGLKTLDLQGNQISDISALAGLTSLTDLRLHGNQISDIGALAGLTNLERLFLSRNQISDISVLAGLTNLTELYLSGNQISDISALAGLTQLPALYLGGNQISDISVLAGLTQLPVLYLGGNQISDISALAGLTSLTDLHLNDNQISDISALAGLTSLTALYLNDNQISDISALAGLTSLTTLRLYNNSTAGNNNQISDISALAGLTQLRDLSLSFNQIRDMGALEGLTSLRSLSIRGNPISDYEPLRRLKAKNPNLSIDIKITNNAPVFTDGTGTIRTIAENTAAGVNIGVPITATDADNHTPTYTLSGPDASAFRISWIGQLRTRASLDYETKSSYSVKVTASDVMGGSDSITVTIKVTDIGDATLISNRTPQVRDGIVAAVPDVNDYHDVTDADLAKITRLYLGSRSITALKVGDFDGLTKLTNLSLYDNQIGDISALEDLTNLTFLRYLYLNNNQISDISALEDLTQLTNLSLGANQIRDISALAGLTSLTNLYLNDNQIRDISVLKGLTQLRGLHLYDNQIRDIGALEGLTSLTELHLYDNQIRDISVLKGLTQLGSLHLYDNQIRDTGALEGLTSLSVLRIRGNPISDYGPLRRLKKKKPNMFIDIEIPAEKTNNAPVFADGTGTTRAIAENTAAGANIGTAITATDADNDALTYTLGGTDAAAFRILPATGQLRTNAALDYETKRAYTVTLTVSDGKGDSASITVTIRVTDIGDATLISNRTPQVRGAIIAAVPGISDYRDVTDADLAAIPRLNLRGKSITALKTGDFEGLTNLINLSLDLNRLTSLPAGIFDNLTKLTTLNLQNNRLNSVSAGVFDNLTRLTRLWLNSNRLTALPADIFDNLAALKDLRLLANHLSSLPVGIFDNLTALTYLQLGSNKFATFPVGILSNLKGLVALNLSGNQLRALPAGIFAGFTGLEILRLGRNAIDPLPVPVSLQKIGEGQFKAVAPTGAPFPIVLPLRVTNGSIRGGATQVTLPSGAVESVPLTVTRPSGTTAAVTVAIRALPKPPDQPIEVEHYGYTLVKSTEAPLEVMSPQVVENRVPVFADGDNTTRTIAENTVSGVDIGTPITATDADNDALTYTLGGTDAAAFRIGPATGQLRTSAALDYETKQSYRVRVTVSDGNSGSDTINASINVTDVGESTLIRNRTPQVRDAIVAAVPGVDAPGNITAAHLSAIRELDLRNQNISTLKPGDFEGLTAVTTLYLGSNRLRRLPAGIFSGLNRLTTIYLGRNELASLPAGIFNGLNALTRLHLRSNQLTSVPDGLFSGLSRLTYLYLHENSVDPLPVAVALEKVGDRQVKAVVPTGAPFDILLPITVENGNVNGGDGTVRISVGSVASAPFRIARTPGTADAVTVDIGTLPRPPQDHKGYALVKFGNLPLEIIGAQDTPNRAPIFVDGITTTLTIAENTATGQNIGNPIAATDADNDTLTYSLGGTDAGAFTVQPRTGQLHTRASLDYETKRFYTVAVTVSDGTLTDIIAVIINVTDVNEAPANEAPANLGVCNVGDVLAPGESCTYPGTDAVFSVLDNGRSKWDIPNFPWLSQASVGDAISFSAGINDENYHFVAKAVPGNAWKIEEIGDSGGQQPGTPEPPQPPEEPENVGGPLTLSAAAAVPLTEATLDESVVTLTLSGGTYERWLEEEHANAFRVSGIAGVTFKSTFRTFNPFFDVDRISDTQVSIELEFDGTNFDTDSVLTFTVGADTIEGYSGPALIAQVSVSAGVAPPVEDTDDTPPVTDQQPETSEPPQPPEEPGNVGGPLTLSAAAAVPLTEATLDESVVTLTLSGGTYERWLEEEHANAFRVSGIAGVTFKSTFRTFNPFFDVDRISDTQVSIELEFDGTNFDTDSVLTFTVGADTIEGYSGPTLTAQVSVSAGVAPPVEDTDDTPPVTDQQPETPEPPQLPEEPGNVGGPLTLSAAVATPLTEATLHENIVTLMLSGGSYERSRFRIRDAITLSGVQGVSVETFGINRVSDTQVTVELEFAGNMDTNGTLTFTVGPGAFKDYDGAGLTAQLPVTANTESVVASTGSPLTEATLDESVVTLTLTGRKYARSRDVRDAVRVSGIPGVTVRRSFDIDRVSDTQVTVELTFDGTNFDTDSVLTFTVGADALAGYSGPQLTAQLSVTAIRDDALGANFPNPFNPETWIPYQLSKPAAVTVTIYNIRGVVVRRLALGHQPAGLYQTRSRAAYWDGRNALGEPVASGLYFYTLIAGDFTATRKMLIRK